MDALPSPDHCFSLLRRAGWSLGESCWLGAAGVVWRVDGCNGENVIRAGADSQAAAWRAACEQARSLEMLGRSRAS